MKCLQALRLYSRIQKDVTVAAWEGVVWAWPCPTRLQRSRVGRSPLRCRPGLCTAHSAQIFTSCDSTILASVFLILSAVSLEAGLWAQHSDMSFRTARRH